MAVANSPEVRSQLQADVSSILNVIGDPVSRDILSTGMGGAVTAEELATRCGVSESTIYRRLDTLVALGLVERCNQFVSDSSAKSSYRTVVDGLTVRVDEGGVSVERSSADPLVDAMEVVADSLDLRHVSYDAGSNTVDVQFSLDDDRFQTLMMLSQRLSDQTLGM
jgi:DNA-binding HxlR family transcriptional regulator